MQLIFVSESRLRHLRKSPIVRRGKEKRIQICREEKLFTLVYFFADWHLYRAHCLCRRYFHRRAVEPEIWLACKKYPFQINFFKINEKKCFKLNWLCLCFLNFCNQMLTITLRVIVYGSHPCYGYR